MMHLQETLKAQFNMQHSYRTARGSPDLYSMTVCRTASSHFVVDRRGTFGNNQKPHAAIYVSCTASEQQRLDCNCGTSWTTALFQVLQAQRSNAEVHVHVTHSLTHCTFGDASKLHGVKAQLGPSKHYVNHRQPWLYGTQGPRRRYTERRTVGKVTQRPWIQRTRQMHHCKRLTRYRTQNCQLLAQNSVTVPTAALTQLRGLSSPPATPHVVVDTESLLKSRFDNSAFARRVRRRVRRA